MKAIIETGGKQYVVSPGDKINIEKIIAESSKEHIIEKVLLVKKEDGSVITGNPYIDNASVVAKVVDHFKDKKVKVFKLKEENITKKQLVIDNNFLALRFLILTFLNRR